MHSTTFRLTNVRCAFDEVKGLGKTAHDESRLTSIPLRLARNVTNDVVCHMTRSAKMHAHGLLLFEVVVKEPILHCYLGPPD